MSPVGCVTGSENTHEDFPTKSGAESAPIPQTPKGARSRYEIEAVLDADAHEIVGEERIHWINHSNRPLRELYFHLYLNAFKRGSRFLDPVSGGSRSGAPVGREGEITVHSLTTDRSPHENLWPHAEAASTEFEHDRTDLRVPLPFVVEPGERLSLSLSFHAVLPEIVERTGYGKDFHLLAQWFPKLAKLESNGQFSHDTFHPFAEFYADFSDYSVLLDVPAELHVGSSGKLSWVSESQGRTRYRATANNVVDFAWTAFPDALVTEQRLSGVDVRLLTPKNARRSREIHLRTIEQGLKQLGTDYGTYPYPTLTVVQPPAHANRSGGMEYPTFITTGGSDIGALVGSKQTELLVIHELAHQWFQSMVATDERRFPFLDESLTSYAEWRYLTQNYGSGSLLDTPWIRLSRLAGGRFSAFIGSDPDEHLNQPASSFRNFRNLSQHIYARAPLALLTLGRVYGPERLTAALGDYARTYRYAHPGLAEFKRVLILHFGSRSRQAVHALLETPGGFNLRVDGVSTAPRGSAALSRSSVTVLATQTLGLPFEVLVRFTGGSERRFQLSGQKKKEVIEFSHASPLTHVLVDPERHLLIDEDFRDNRYEATMSNDSGRTRTFAVLWFQFLLAFLRA